MIYIQLESNPAHIELTKLSDAIKPKYFTLWFYPDLDEKIKNEFLSQLSDFKLKKAFKEPATIYPGEKNENLVDLYSVEALKNITSLKNIKKHIDSICLALD
jgi:hypothetical protein